MSRLDPPRAGEVHLWRASLEVSPPVAEHLRNTLSADEEERARRLRRPGDAGRYECARGWLRLLIGGYVGSSPASIAFGTGEHGKPRLSDESLSWLRFNASHSGDVAVYAVATEREVGVDVERIRDDLDVIGVARRFLTARQHRELSGLGAEARITAFFAMWTRNEAYLKATGTGLAGADREINLDLLPGWSLATFDAAGGYAASVAVEGDSVAIPEQAAELSCAT